MGSNYEGLSYPQMQEYDTVKEIATEMASRGFDPERAYYEVEAFFQEKYRLPKSNEGKIKEVFILNNPHAQTAFREGIKEGTKRKFTRSVLETIRSGNFELD